MSPLAQRRAKSGMRPPAPSEDWDGEAGEEYNAAPQDPSLSEEGGDASMEAEVDDGAIEELPEELIVEEEGPDFETTNPYVLVESCRQALLLRTVTLPAMICFVRGCPITRSWTRKC